MLVRVPGAWEALAVLGLDVGVTVVVEALKAQQLKNQNCMSPGLANGQEFTVLHGLKRKDKAEILELFMLHTCPKVNAPNGNLGAQGSLPIAATGRVRSGWGFA